MAFPAGVILRPVTFGPAFELEDGGDAGMTVAIKATRSGMLWRATGQPGISNAITASASDGLQQTLMLPVTDQVGWGDGDGNALIPGENGHVFLYTVSVKYTQDGRDLPGGPRSKNVPIPTGDLSPLDLDDLISLTTPGGSSVAIPDIWSELIEQAQAAAAAAEASVVDSEVFVTSTVTDDLASGTGPIAVGVTTKVASGTSTALTRYTAEIRNPETAAYAAVAEVAGSISPAGQPYHFYNATLTSTRPSVAAGVVVVWYITNSNPYITPNNALGSSGSFPGDQVIVRAPEPAPDTPLILFPSTLEAWWQPGAVTTSPADTNAAAIATMPDSSGKGRTLTPMPVATGITTTPTRDDAAFGTGMRGVYFPDYSAMRANPVAVDPAEDESLIVGMNVVWGSGIATANHEVLFAGTASTTSDNILSRYTFGRSADRTKLFIASSISGIPYASAHESAAVDMSLPHSLVAIQTATRTQLWAAIGSAAPVKVVDVDLTSTPQDLGSTSVFALGFNGLSTNAARRASVRNVKMGNIYVARASATQAIDTTFIARQMTMLRKFRGVAV